MVDVSVVDSSEMIDAWDELVASEVGVMVLRGSVVIVADVGSTVASDEDEGGSSDIGDPFIIIS